MHLEPDAVPGALKVSLRPRMEHVWAVRQLVEAHYRPILGDEALLERLTVTTHELVENAAKYGGDGLSSLQIQVTGSPTKYLRVEVRNPINHREVAGLKQVLDDMARAADPGTFYQERMIRAASLDDGGSGLGLARISFEAEMHLSLEVDQDQVVLVAVAPAERLT
jgi:hypothetical protein